MRHLLPALALLATTTLCAPARAQAIDADKQKTIDRIVAAGHFEEAIVMVVQRKAIETLQQSKAAMQGRVAPEKAEQTMKEITTEVQKFVDAATPIAAASAKKSAGPALGPILAKNFSVDELRQIQQYFESPVMTRFMKIAPELNKALLDKVQADSGAVIGGKVEEMNKVALAKLRAVMPAN